MICLALAIPVNICHAIANLITGSTEPFAKRAASLPDGLRKAAADTQRLASGIMDVDAQVGASGSRTPPPTPLEPEIALMVAGVISYMSDYGGDLAFGGIASQSEDEVMDMSAPFVAGVYVFQGISGMAVLTLRTFASQPAFAARVRAVAWKEGSAEDSDKAAKQFLPPYMELVYALYGIQMALRCLKLYSAVDTLKHGIDKKDKDPTSTESVVWYLLLMAIPGSIALIIYQAVSLARLRPILEDFGNSDVTRQYELFASRDIITTAPLMFEWMYTPQGAKKFRKWFPDAYRRLYFLVSTIRVELNKTGLLLHGVSVFGFGR